MKIKDLIDKYKKNKIAQLKENYNETQLRNDFIDPLLKCFGWDVDNDGGKNFFLRDVLQEESIDIKEERYKKNPDYTLRINGTRKLFVEVKKPSVNILNSPNAAFQTRRYGWSANLGISVLTNFEHLIIYDCRYKPEEADNEHVARYKFFSYEEYEEKYEEISKLISYAAVNTGLLETNFSSEERVGETFDRYFLQQIENWREKLASSAIINNPDLDEENVNYVVQRFLNRIIFLRICEDRAIEKYETLRSIKNFEELKILFKNADKKFNSGLFDFLEDILSLEVQIDSNVIIEIFNELYFPQSPYDFSVVDSTILSQIYEHFLSRRIIINEDRTFSLIEAPEVSASSGVVSTPKIIVEQIVHETLTPLVADKSFDELNQLKIADICCGSGTFLISAYDFIIEKKMERYIKELKNDSNLVYRMNDNEIVFTLKAKREILENNIFGGDINPYAVEVTEFSLLLKLLEGENESTINDFIQCHDERVLPNLKSNIRCGNSLVDNKFYDFMPNVLNEDELLYKIKPFDWNEEFPEIMSKGGFDAIIGNPPYVRIQNMKKYSPEEIAYYKSGYTVAKKATIDKYFVFIQRALGLLKETGVMGYIVPHKFFLISGGKELRKLITENYQISKIIHFGTTQVFPERSTYTAILILQTVKKDYFEFARINKITPEFLSTIKTMQYETQKYGAGPWIFLSTKTEDVFNKFSGDDFIELGMITDISVGLQTSADKIYIFVPQDETENTFIFQYANVDYEIEKSICRSAIYDLSFSAFDTIEGNAQIIFPYMINNNEAELFEETYFENTYPLAWKYLSSQKEILVKRNLQGNNPKWYQFGRSQSLVKFNDSEKLVWSVLSTQAPYVLDKKNLLFTGGGNGPYYGLLNKSKYSLLYFLGILSHPVIEAMVKSGASEFRGDYYSHGKQFIEKLPIKKIDFENKMEVELYDIIIDAVNNLIVTTSIFKSEKNSERRKVMDRKMELLRKKIISSINKLYNISDKEFETVLNDKVLSTVTGEDS
ncbi:N-6 DNA methylase [Listeria monocytogenes]|uniref:Eco57I restriction-modification methylase domain-containing protein n=1 Tax=Listeria monocytogenes TaxID=1639 RepID=UPI0005447CBC|nr:N-6 DNA methylase [Listeria monocytogenes]EAC5142053.1 endonuclease [Listeria monocytogenes]EAC7686792.1 endonuclease [Listeria monocytogenes]EAC7907028.1 endonuclease [Listeria monocytogenes]EAC8076376.1 endonuclease [Listeria monocytogenes]EAC9017145.1 endonuclease [Listeria monocytogenes]